MGFYERNRGFCPLVDLVFDGDSFEIKIGDVFSVELFSSSFFKISGGLFQDQNQDLLLFSSSS